MRLLGHPIHPAVVHFPLALLGTSLAFDLAGLFTEREAFWSIAFWNIALGLVIAPVTALAGLVDSLQVKRGHPASRTLTLHLSAMLGAVSCYAIALVVRRGPGVPVGSVLWGTLALEVAGLGLLLFGGWLGGELVYRYGVGRVEPG